jgi:protease PrsW
VTSLSGSLVAFGILQAIIYLLFIRAIDLYEREPLRYVVPVFVWGFTVAVIASLFFNTIFTLTLSAVTTVRVANFLTAVVGAPIIEECSKGLALLLVFLVAYLRSRRRGGVIEFAGVMDGIVYGSAVGFGFAIAEDILYGVQFGAETFVVRRIFGGFAHASFTSLTGIGIGLIPWVRQRALAPVPPLLGLLAAILLHASFNFIATVFGPLAYGVLFLALLLYLVIIVVWLAVERRAMREELRDEVGKTITSEEYAMLPSYFRRTGHYLGLILRGRLGTWSRERKIHGAAVDLALAKRLARRARRLSQEDRVLALRRKILDLRGEAVPRAAS